MSANLILNFSTPPSIDDIQGLAESLMDDLPAELDDICDDLEIIVDHFPDQVVMDELQLETDFDLLALYQDADNTIGGMSFKNAKSSKTLTLYRRPILDMWCETEDDLQALVRHLMITELAQYCGYEARDIERLANG